MMDGIRQWLSQIVCFLCLMTVLLHIIPDTGLKKYVRFFLGLLLVLVVMGPVGQLVGMEKFLENFELESLKALERDYETGNMGLGDILPQWDEEAYQRELEEKVREVYDTYHIPSQESHTNNQNMGVENGESADYR